MAFGDSIFELSNPSLSDHTTQGSDVSDEKETKDAITWKDLMDTLDPLSAQIFEFQKTVEQSATSLCEKLYLRDLIYCALAPHFAGCGLYIVGSTLNGFGNECSDMDLCLMVSQRELNQQTEAALVLDTVKEHLKSVQLIQTLEVIRAKVPILRATFKPPFEKVVVDLNANNTVSIRNTYLLYHYSGYDWRVRPLVYAIKAWAKSRGINNANQSTLTSYSLVLMLINYLQRGTGVGVLPSLQCSHKEQFSTDVDVRNLDILKPLEETQALPKNMMSLGDLLKGFFYYYAYTFNFDTSVASVRVGHVLSRTSVVSQHSGHELAQWRCICVEEPFSKTNAAHSVYEEKTFEYIKNSFKHAYLILKRDNDLITLLRGDLMTNGILD